MLINGIYDPSLFGLRGVDPIESNSGSYWASSSRYSSVRPGTNDYLAAASGGIATSEIIELDYGRVRQVMGIVMDIMRMPINVTIQYDAISSNSGAEHEWIDVTPEPGLRFEDRILYDASAASSFYNAEFYFSDAQGEVIHTRFLRITFQRQSTPWPTSGTPAMPYPVIVKNLRTFRTVSDHSHMAGPLFMSDIDTGTSLLQLDVKADLTTHELTQRFTFPVDAPRGEGTADTGDDIIPSLLGFSFLAEVENAPNSESDDIDPVSNSVKWRWSLWDVTGDPVELDKGLTSGASHSGRCWINCYFSRPLDGSMDTTYEIRLSSRYTPASSAVYTSVPVDVPGFQIPSTISATRRSRLMSVDDLAAGTGLAQIGDYIQAIDGLNSHRIVSIGQPGGYASFDGVSGRIDIGYDAALNSTSWSVAFWYRRDAATMDGVESVIIDNSEVGGDGWRIGIGPDLGTLDSALQVTVDTGPAVTLYDIENTADGEWHHAFVTFDNGTGTLKLYRDGTLRDSDNTITYTPNNTVPICIGAKWGTDWDNLVYGSGPWTNPDVRYEGDLDDIALFNDDMTAVDVTELYDAGHGGSGTAAVLQAHAELVALLQLNDEPGSTTAVDTEAAYDGTVQPSGVSFTGEVDDEYLIETHRGWREANGSRKFFIVPRMTYVANEALSENYDRNLALRMWSDTGDSGRDVLGNQYRYATRLLDSASRVLDPASSGWMSAPRPSPEAVESLYFDVRQAQDTGQNEFAIIDNIRVAPRTHGVRMHVYYSRDNLHGEAPRLTDDWDRMLWTPVNEVYVLRSDKAIQLPQGIQASYVKLEFTNLRPMPFEMSPFPELPPVPYKRHPTWVENAFENTKVRNSVEDWFIQTSTPVQRRIMQEIADPIQEFAYKHREFMTALAQGRLEDTRVLGSGIIDSGTDTFVDPVTATKIRLGSNQMFRGSLTATIRTESLLGKALAARSTPIPPLARELQPQSEARSPFVSTRGDRVTHSFSTLAETPMWFNRRCRHFYRIDKARFNRKAYYVGIRDVEFRRNDYTVEFDDTIIDDNLYDDEFLDLNSFVRDPMTRIEDGQTVYVSYVVGDVTYTDVAIDMDGTTFRDLSGSGHVAKSVEVFSQPNRRGVQYDIETDYLVSYAYDADGDITSQIARSDLTEFLEVNPDALIGVTFRDSGVVLATASPSEADE